MANSLPLTILCPACRTPIGANQPVGQALTCPRCRKEYPWMDGVLHFVPHDIPC